MKKLFVATFLILLCLAGCKVQYSFTGASIAPDVKTISIKNFDNYAPLAQPVMSQEFTESLREIFRTQTSLAMVDNYGDLEFEGEIVGYMTAPQAAQGNETAAINRLTVTVKVRFKNNKDATQNFEQSFSRFADYESNEDLSTVEDALIAEVNEQLVQDIFNRSVSNW